MAVPGLLANWPRLRFQIAWNTGGLLTTAPNWTDLTYRLQGSWTATTSGRQYELDQVASGQASVTLDNTDGMFDSLNSAGPYVGSIVPYRFARMTATWPPTQNLLPQSLANGTDLVHAKAVTGTMAIATVTAPASGQSTAVAWTFPATAALGGAVGLGAAAAVFSQADADAVPVVDLKGPATGKSWTFSVYVSAAAGGTAGLQVTPRISWYRQDGTRISTADGTAVTVPLATSWIRAVSTSTAPAGAVWARVAILNTGITAVSNTVYATGWQWEEAGAATSWADPGATYSLWTGYAERFKQRWKGAQGFVDIPCVDVLAGLSRMDLQPSLKATLLALGPSRCYPLDEPQGSTTFRDLTGRNRPLTIRTSNLGAGTLTAGNSVTGTGSVGSAGPVVTLANVAPNNASQALSYLAIPTPNGPPSTGGWARILAFRTSSVPPAGTISALWWWGGATGTPSQGGIWIDEHQNVWAQSQNAAGQSAITTINSVAVCDGNWHLVQMVLFPDGKTLSIDVDGAALPVGAANDMHSTGITTDNLGANANPVNKSFVWPFSGDLAYATELPTHLVPGFADLATGFATAWSGETSAARAQRILTLAGYPGAFTALGTATLMGPANFAGADAVSYLNVVADSEAGQAYADGAGTVTLAGRRWRYLHYTADVTFGENFAGGEVPYLGGVEVDLDPDHVYNTIDVTNQTAPGAAAQPDVIATNTASQLKYFASSESRTINVLDPNEAIAAAGYLASQYAEPQPRISKVTIDPSANPALWAQVLPLGFGSRATLMRRPNNAPAQQVETFIEQMAWKGDDAGRLQLSAQLSAAAPYLGWWVVASLHTTVHTASAIGAATIVLNPLTGSALNPAAAVLPPGTVLTLSYGDVFHQENVTVLSVGATSPGYTSVTITLTAPANHSHPVNAVVCQPLPGGYTMPASALAGFPASLDPNATLSATGPRIPY